MRLITAIAAFAGLFCSSFFAGCALLNPEEELPVYVTLRAPGVRLRDDDPFVSSLGVRDAWVDQGAGSIGIYKFPVTFPVYPSNGQEIVLSGGILNSGVGISRSKYPFWKSQIHSIANLKPLDTLVITPEFEYLSQDSVLAITFEDDFESSIGGSDGKLEAIEDDPEVAPLERTSQGRYQGAFSGKVTLTSTATKFEIESTAAFYVPRTATNDTYVEVTYKGDLPFMVGLKASTGELTDNILFYNDEWTTVYIHIGDFVRQAQVSDKVVLFMRGSGVAGQTVWLDNIRVVQFR